LYHSPGLAPSAVVALLKQRIKGKKQLDFTDDIYQAEWLFCHSDMRLFYPDFTIFLL